MSRVNSWRFYITPFKDDGTYGTEIDVTTDIDFTSVGNITRELDNNDYDIGIIKNSSIVISLNNVDGKYSDVDVIESIFRYTRNRSLVRISFSYQENPNRAGMMVAGHDWLFEEQTIFQGFLNDDGAYQNLSDHKINFTVLGQESLFDNVTVNMDDISVGMNVARLIERMLNQTEITQFLTVDIANIVPGVSLNSDEIVSYTNKTVKEAVSDLLLLSSSILYIKDSVVYVAARTPTIDSKITFYGQAAINGIENIINIDSVKTGFDRVFNYLTWADDSSIVDSNAESIVLYKVKKREFNVGFFTDSAKILTFFAALISEFRFPKQEFNLTTAYNFETMGLNFLDRVTIDYPPIVVPGAIGGTLPICGQAICGEALLPKRLYNFSIDPPSDFKIMNISIDPKNGLITFRMRKI